MKKNTSLLALLLAVCMMAGTLIACADTTDPNTTPTPSVTDQPTGTPTDEPEKELTAGDIIKTFEKKSYGGVDFVVAASSNYENIIAIQQFPTEDQMTGDMVHDALFSRDKLIEEYFEVSLVYDDIYDSTIYGKLSNGIRTGDDEYSLILGNLPNVTLPFFNAGLLYDYSQLDAIDLTQTWWNKNSIDNFMVNDRIFMATGAISNRYVYAPYAMLFNTRLLDDKGLENPYSMVKNNTWTFENFADLITDCYYDLNANDSIDLEDFYGLAPASDSETAYFFGCGCHFVTKDGDELTLTLGTDENYTVLEMVAAMYATKDVLDFSATYDSNTAFKEGRAIFHSTALCDITMLSNMEDLYGIVPMPKYDSDQESYYSNPNRYISSMALIPNSIPDSRVQDAAVIIEALAAISQYTSLDKQYESVLLNRQAFDSESKQNLITVVESINYDWLYVNNLGDLENGVRTNIKAGKNEFSSLFESKGDAAQDALDKLIAKYED